MVGRRGASRARATRPTTSPATTTRSPIRICRGRSRTSTCRQLTVTQARDRSALLGNATTRFVYHFGEADRRGGKSAWGARPAGACAIAARDACGVAGGRRPASPLQVAFECSDGDGQRADEARRRPSRSRPAAPLRWIVKRQDRAQQQGQAGQAVRAVLQRSAELPLRGRRARGGRRHAAHVLRRGRPAGAHRAAGRHLQPGRVLAVARHDLRRERHRATTADWYAQRLAPAHGSGAAAVRRVRRPQTRAPRLAAQHADTPALTILDSLGPRGHRHRAQPDRATRTWRPRTDERYAHLHQARRRGQAAVDPRRARQPGDAVHHAGAGRHDASRRDATCPTSCGVPATTSPATCSSSTAWTPATAGC